MTFTGDFFKYIGLDENAYILMEISLKPVKRSRQHAIFRLCNVLAHVRRQSTIKAMLKIIGRHMAWLSRNELCLKHIPYRV